MTTPAKISQTGKVSKRRIALWCLAFILLIVLALALLVWQYRYHLLEHKIRQVFAENGFDATLEINFANTDKMVIENLTISSGGKRSLAASRIELEYDYKRALQGELERIKIMSPVMNLTLDKSGKILDNWFPQNSGEGSFAFPSRGVSIDDATVYWRAPFGHAKTTVSVEASSATHWNLIYQSPDTVLSNDDVSLILDLTGGALQEHNGEITSFGSIISKRLATPNLRMGKMKTDYRLHFAKNKSGEIDTKGWVNLGGEVIETQKYTAGTVALKLDIITVFDPKNNVFGDVSGSWKLQTTKSAIKNSVYRQQVSKQLTAYRALQQAPIARHFAGILPTKLASLLAGFSVSGEGELAINNEGYQIKFTDNFVFQNRDQNLTISPNGPKNLVYQAQDNRIVLDAHIDWSGENAVRLLGLKAKAVSLNGLQVDSVTSIFTRLQTREHWNQSKDGHSLRLSPFEIDLNYKQHLGVRDILVSGALGYDGLVPGGTVKGLRADGVLSAQIGVHANKNFTLGFKPIHRIYLDGFTSLSGWQAQDVTFTMPATKTLIHSVGARRELQTSLQNLSAQLISPTQDRHMNIIAKNIGVHTHMSGFPKVWNLDIADAVLKSDDFPSPGTHIRSHSSQLVLEQNENGDLHFTSDNPGTFIETDNIHISKIDVKMNGTPEKFQATYASPKVEFKGGAVPVLPVNGTAIFDNGVLTGDAVANLYRGKADTPINISFTSRAGRGRINIDIKSMRFTPNGMQPQFLISSLKGKLAEVSGQVNANLKLEFGGGGPVHSYGTTDLVNLDMGTLVGPLRGVNARLEFSSLFPLQTDGIQMATLAGFDPGFPLVNGRIQFEIIPGGVRIDEALWPIQNNVQKPDDDGLVFIDPMLWRFGNTENLATIHVQNLELASVFEKVGKEKLLVTGKVSGILPTKINGVDVLVDNGKLEVKDGGIIKFKTASQAADVAAQKNEYAGHGLRALENLTYKKMQALIDGPLDGSVSLNVIAEGYNPDVLSGQKFMFDVDVEGELANIARNLSKSFSTQENIKRVLGLNSSESK